MTHLWRLDSSLPDKMMIMQTLLPNETIFATSLLHMEASLLHKEASLLYKDASSIHKDASFLHKDTPMGLHVA